MFSEWVIALSTIESIVSSMYIYERLGIAGNAVLLFELEARSIHMQGIDGCKMGVRRNKDVSIRQSVHSGELRG